ncbi:MAG: efflux RND transporter permease subunit, partial [Enterobacteriaceae bacterium]
GALVGIALVLSAVFIPMGFFGGTTGAIYRQFSVTIVSAMILSVLVALILTPALCATLLKPVNNHQTPGGFFALFNRQFTKQTRRYQLGVHKLLRHRPMGIVAYVLLLGALAWLFVQLPTSFLPKEDRGVFMVSVTLPPGSTQQQTLQVVQKVENYLMQQEKPYVESVMATLGSGSGGSGQSVARMFVKLTPWSERKSDKASSFAIVDRASRFFNQLPEAQVSAMNPPAISGLGNAGGFEMMLEDHAGLGHPALMAAKDQLLQLVGQEPQLTRVRHNGLADSPQLQLHIDQTKAKALGISLEDINSTLKTALGSTYVNDFIDRGRLKKVYIQAAAPYRMLPQDLNSWYVRNNKDQMVPFSAFMTSEWTVGSPRLERFNGYPSLQIVGDPASGYSSGDAMQAMEKVVAQLPTGIGMEWTGASYQERLSGSQAPLLYAMSLLFVFLCLAALYESWSIPFSVMLVVPVGVIGAAAATWLRGLDNDVYFQVGLLTVVGLTAKNAILIVEFAHVATQKGASLRRAIQDACRMRLRPIVMTSLALIFGVLPMAISRGAGASSQHSVGTGVIGGMIAATLLAIFFTPLFFMMIRKYFPGKKQLNK